MAAGLGFCVAWDKPASSSAATRCSVPASAGTPIRRLVQLRLLDDSEAALP